MAVVLRWSFSTTDSTEAPFRPRSSLRSRPACASRPCREMFAFAEAGAYSDWPSWVAWDIAS
jgi:hypothetical protein